MIGDLLGTLPEAAPFVIDDCWNRIGVRGDGSCPQVTAHVHCRNCPVYAAAAAALLDRDAESSPLDASTRHFAEPRRIDAVDAASIVIFRLRAEWFGLPTAVISEFVDVRPIHSLPHRKDGIVLGLANVRGELLICVSLARVLGVAETAKQQPTGHGAAVGRLVVMRDKERRVAFPADEVHGIHRFSPGELTAVPATVAKGTATYTRAMLGWRNTAVGCLDEHLLQYSLDRSLA